MRRLAVILCLAALCVPALAGLPGWKRPDARPVTSLTCVKSGDDVVLSWTTEPAGTYRYIVCRGILQPRFYAQRIVANTTNLTWTDEDACLRTRHGQLVSEFYRVYALEQPKPPPLKPKAVQSEYRGRPRDASVAVKYTVTNGDLDSYIWAFKASIPAGYEAKPWVLVGQDKGAVALLKFIPKNGQVEPLGWVPFPAPNVKQAWGQGGAANFATPAVDAALVVRWELLKNGAVLSAKVKVDDGEITTKTHYQLRGVLAGGPKANYLYSDVVELTPDTEVSA